MSQGAFTHAYKANQIRPIRICPDVVLEVVANLLKVMLKPCIGYDYLFGLFGGLELELLSVWNMSIYTHARVCWPPSP